MRWTDPRSTAGVVARCVLDRLFPASCVLCGAPGRPLCGPCRDDAVRPLRHGCFRCAVPLPEPSVACGRCLRRAPAYDRTFAAATYEAPFDQLIRAFKYGATLAHAPLFADLLLARIASDARAIDAFELIVPVPLSRERLASRGFNQSLEIARILTARLGKPLDGRSVLRVHDTQPQASLPFAARRRNMRGAFHVIDARRPALAGRDIAVVDDVMTTGATLDELARTLKRAGARSVTNLVVARTP